jgi:hypothetical protein
VTCAPPTQSRIAAKQRNCMRQPPCVGLCAPRCSGAILCATTACPAAPSAARVKPQSGGQTIARGATPGHSSTQHLAASATRPNFPHRLLHYFCAITACPHCAIQHRLLHYFCAERRKLYGV